MSLHDLEQLFDDDRRESERELVDHHKLRAGDEGAREQELLLLAAGERAGELAAPVGEPREGLDHVLDLRRCGAPVAAVDRGRQSQVLAHGEAGERSATAGHLHDAPANDLVRRETVDALAGEA